MFSGKVYIAFSVTGLMGIGLFLLNTNTETASVSVQEKQKGVCWVGQPQAITETHINDVKVCGVNWISQTPFGWQRNPGDTLIRAETSSQTPWWGESKKGIAITTALARKQGIKTLLKPHLWVRNSWPGAIEMNSEDDWKKWFQHYENFILPYAAIGGLLKD